MWGLSVSLERVTLHPAHRLETPYMDKNHPLNLIQAYINTSTKLKNAQGHRTSVKSNPLYNFTVIEVKSLDTWNNNLLDNYILCGLGF